MSDQDRNDNFFNWLYDEDDETGGHYGYKDQEGSGLDSNYGEGFGARNSGYSNDNYRYVEESPEVMEARIKAYVDSKIKKARPKHRGLKVIALILVGAILGSFIGLYFPDRLGLFGSNDKVEALKPNDRNMAINISTKDDLNIESAVAKKSTPSVVGIIVNVKRNIGFFYDREVMSQSMGSGVILSEDGYILTNAHVIAEANQREGVEVLFHDNKTAKGRVLWKDPTLDLAIVKVEASGLQAIELGDSSKVEVGNKAIAIGNPVGLNLQSTLTSGYISGINRSINMDDGFILDGLFQTDAAINSGNSGGALLDKEGKLIGINTAKVQSSDGIGFAIPINVAKPVIESFIEKGSFRSVQLGISAIDLQVYKQHYQVDPKLEKYHGVVVVDLQEGGNAKKAGIKEGDLITSINGNNVESMNSLKQNLLSLGEGDIAKIILVRAGEERTVEVQFFKAEPNI